MPWDYSDFHFYSDLDTYGSLATTEVEVPLPVPSPGPGPVRTPIPRVHWTIDGTTVSMDEGNDPWSAITTAPGGFAQFRGSLTESQWRKLSASGQGSVIRGESENEVVWEGTMPLNPQILDTRARITGVGYSDAASKRTKLVPGQLQDAGIWSELDGEPFVDAQGAPIYMANRRFDVRAGARIRLSVARDVALAAGTGAGVGAYMPGTNLKRISFTFDRDVDDSATNMAIRVHRATGPAGPQIQSGADHICSMAPGTDITAGWAADAMEIVTLYLISLTAHTPVDPRAYRLVKMRINGDVPTGRSGDPDIFNGDEMVAYLGGLLGWDTSGVTPADFNVFPWWADDPWDEQLDRVAEMEDRYWGVYETRNTLPLLAYRDWGLKTFNVYQSGGARFDLAQLVRYAFVRVRYQSPSGLERFRTVAADPSPGGDAVYDYTLTGRHLGSGLADAVGAKIASRVSRETFAGRIVCTSAFDQGRNNLHGLRAGDHVRAADFGPGRQVTLRVIEDELTPNEKILTVERPVNLRGLAAGVKASYRKSKSQPHPIHPPPRTHGYPR